MTDRRTYTVGEAARRLCVTDARVRQILMCHPGLGRKVGLSWELTDDDIHRISLRRTKIGRPSIDAVPRPR